MKKTFQPFIIELSKRIIEILDNDVNFFKEENVTDISHTEYLLCEKLTEKFIKGELSNEVDIMGLFTKDEFETILNQIKTKSLIDNLVNFGYINYYEDENGEERFFLTNEGKEYAKQNNITAYE